MIYTENLQLREGEHVTNPTGLSRAPTSSPSQSQEGLGKFFPNLREIDLVEMGDAGNDCSIGSR